MRSMTCVVNPYALTEVLLRKKINWRRIARPIELVSRTLETPAEDLFDGGKGSPIFALQDALGSLYSGHDPSFHGPQGRDDFPIPGRDRLVFRQDISLELRARIVDILLGLFGETEDPRASWLDVGDYFEEGTEFSDPVQGALGDCWLIAALASVAWSRPYAIKHQNRATGPGKEDFVDAIDLQDPPAGAVRFEVTEKLPVWKGTTWPLYGRSSETGEIWPGIHEKAFAKLRTGNLTDKPNFASLNGGDGVDACARLVPGSNAHYFGTNASPADDLWRILVDNSMSNPGTGGRFALQRAGRTINPMVAWTYPKAADAPDAIDYGPSGIVGSHCYSVLGWLSFSNQIQRQRQRYIVLRNPWGLHEGNVDVASGSWSAYDQSWMRATPLNAGGVFAMEIEAFKKYYQGLGFAS